MPTTISDQLTAYLSDAHSIEEQALAQLRTAPDLAAGERMKQAFRDHLIETEDHERSTRWLLEGRDSSPSWFKDFVMKVGGKGFILFARANPDTPGKLLAHSVSYEGLEEASYVLLGTVAREAAEAEVAEAAERIRAQETAMRERLEGCYDEGVDESLRALGEVDLPGAGGQVSGGRARDRGAGDPAARACVGPRRRQPRRDAYAAHLVRDAGAGRGGRGPARRARARPLDDEGRPDAHGRDELDRVLRGAPRHAGQARGVRVRLRVARDRAATSSSSRLATRAGDTETVQLAQRDHRRGARGGREAPRPAARGGAALADGLDAERGSAGGQSVARRGA